MRKPVFFITLNAALMLLVFAFMVQSLVIIQMIGTADRVQGVVEVKRRGGDWKPLAAREAIHAYDTVRTASAGTVELRWRDGTRMRLAPQTTLTIKKFAQHVVAKSRVSLFDLTLGKVWVRVSQTLQPKSRFEIETPTAVASVRGTIFSVAVTAGDTAVSVYEGKVTVLDARKQNLDLEAGRAAELTAVASFPRAVSATETQTWALQEHIVGPGLLLEEPSAETEAITTSTVRLKGYVEPLATLTINGIPVKSRMGQFNYLLRLAPGKNPLNLVATDVHGRQTTITRSLILAPSS